MGEELREIRDLYDTEKDKKMCGEEEIRRLHNQVLDAACDCICLMH